VTRQERRPGRSGYRRDLRSASRSGPTAWLPAPARSGIPAAASRARPAWTFRIWIQVITGRLGGSAACPGTLSSPWRQGRTPARDRPAGRAPGRWPGRACHGRSGGCGPGERSEGPVSLTADGGGWTGTPPGGSSAGPPVSHADPRITMRYDNSRVLHQTGEKPQVARSRRRRNRVPRISTAAL